MKIDFCIYILFKIYLWAQDATKIKIDFLTDTLFIEF